MVLAPMMMTDDAAVAAEACALLRTLDYFTLNTAWDCRIALDFARRRTLYVNLFQKFVTIVELDYSFTVGLFI